MLFTCKNFYAKFMFSNLTWKKNFAAGNGRGLGEGQVCFGCPPFFMVLHYDLILAINCNKTEFANSCNSIKTFFDNDDH